MLIALAAALAQPAPPPPIVTTAARAQETATVAAAAETLQIRMSGGGRLIWQGLVRVSRSQGIDFDQSLTQASDLVCPSDYSDGRAQRQSISLNIYPQQRSAGDLSYRMTASWQRPVAPQCAGSHSRTVQVEKTFILDDRGTATITGDADLTIEVTRHRG